MTWSWGFVWQILPTLLTALWVTVKVSMVASIIALVLGLLIAIIRFQKIPIISPVLTLVIDFLRGTPLLIQLYFVFFALPAYGLKLTPFVAGAATLGVNFSAYTAEAYRGGLESVPRGQWDAVAVLGLPRSLAWWRVIIPQALRPIEPQLGNYVIVMFKESVLLSVITLPEVMTAALNISSQTYHYLEPITLLGVLFWAISYPCARAIRYWEKRVSKSYE